MGSALSLTLIDVGWGDSILLESTDSSGNTYYALIDSNDRVYLRSSYIFLKRYFEKKGVEPSSDSHLFEFVVLTHAHTDHGQGLKAILREFGTKSFWYPKSLNWSSLADLIRYSNRSKRVLHHQAIDSSRVLPPFGDVEMEVLWPPYNEIDQHNENNNSIVLALRLNRVCFVLTGDAESKVWRNIGASIPADTKFFKVPHHGSVNGTFDGNHTPWLDNCPEGTVLAISSHIRPYPFPSPRVLSELDERRIEYYRTDRHYHITVWTDGQTIDVSYHHKR